eukprot:1903304-Amphidinium_carterae.1
MLVCKATHINAKSCQTASTQSLDELCIPRRAVHSLHPHNSNNNYPFRAFIERKEAPELRLLGGPGFRGIERGGPGLRRSSP